MSCLLFFSIRFFPPLFSFVTRGLSLVRYPLATCHAPFSSGFHPNQRPSAFFPADCPASRGILNRATPQVGLHTSVCLQGVINARIKWLLSMHASSSEQDKQKHVWSIDWPPPIPRKTARIIPGNNISTEHVVIFLGGPQHKFYLQCKSGTAIMQHGHRLGWSRAILSVVALIN